MHVLVKSINLIHTDLSNSICVLQMRIVTMIIMLITIKCSKILSVERKIMSRNKYSAVTFVDLNFESVRSKDTRDDPLTRV